jgi:hypothetical protein
MVWVNPDELLAVSVGLGRLRDAMTPAGLPVTPGKDVLGTDEVVQGVSALQDALLASTIDSAQQVETLTTDASMVAHSWRTTDDVLSARMRGPR